MSPSLPRASRGTPSDALLHNVQLLRAFAALAVVFLHATSEAGLRLPLSVGHFGVDIFFVISGFIIPYISAGDPSQFLRKRVIRLVPAYWAATLGLFLLAWLRPNLLHNTRADPVLLVCSLFFIPHDHGVPHAVPLLISGWTLNYEMFFYLLFALGLLVARRNAGPVCAALVLVVLAATRLANPASEAKAYYGQAIVVEFIFGIAIFEACRRFPRLTQYAPARDTGFVAALALAAAAFVFLPLEEYLWDADPQFLLLGGPAAVLVLCAIVLERRYGFFVRNRTVLVLGEASYMLYLIHPYVIYGGMRVLFRGAAQWPEALQWLLVAALLVLAVLVAVGLHLYAEKPVMKFLRRKLLHKPQPIIFAPSESAAR